MGACIHPVAVQAPHQVVDSAPTADMRTRSPQASSAGMPMPTRPSAWPSPGAGLFTAKQAPAVASAPYGGLCLIFGMAGFDVRYS